MTWLQNDVEIQVHASEKVLSDWQTEILRRVTERGVTTIVDPESRDLRELHALLQDTFGSGEVEPLTTLQRELACNEERRRFLALAARDSAANDRIASLAYGSVEDNLLAVRFLVTVTGPNADYRGTGISQFMIRQLVDAAREITGGIQAVIGECVAASETFWNAVFDPPMRRVYLESDGELNELYYELPHLGDWQPDGTPIDPEPVPVLEHLQVAMPDDGRCIAADQLEQHIQTLWSSWYLKDRDDFDNSKAWQRHCDLLLEETLEKRILKPIATAEQLTLMTADERDAARRSGTRIHDLQTGSESE